MTENVKKQSQQISPQNTLAALLTAKKITLRIAESFTGGYLTSLLTAISGASAYLTEAIVCYSPESKVSRLNVAAETIEKYGAVSLNCCREMLKGLLDTGCDIAVATTGNAGPGAEKPGDEGLCFIGAACKDKTVITRYKLNGSREENIYKGAELALEALIDIVK